MMHATATIRDPLAKCYRHSIYDKRLRAMTRLAYVCLAALFLCAAFAPSAAQAELMSDDEAVESGRSAFSRFWGFPWYDEQTDDAQAIDVKPPPPPKAPTGPSNMGSILQEMLVFLGWGLLIVVIAVLVYFLIRAFLEQEMLQASGEKVEDTRSTAAQPDRVEDLPYQIRKTHGSLLEAAEQAYRDGRFDEAIVYLYSYQLVELDKAQVIRLSKGKTNRQYLRETRRRTTIGQILEPAMVACEEVFFGHHSISRERFETCWSQVSAFQQLTQAAREQLAPALA